MSKIKLVEATQLKTNLPEFAPGDTLNVHLRVVEGDKERIQQFQGVVIGKRGSGMGATFTIRKVSDGVGVERIFPTHSPRIAKIEKINRAGCAGRSCTTCATLPRNRSDRKPVTESRVPGNQFRIGAVPDFFCRPVIFGL